MSSSILLLGACLQLMFGGFFKKFSYNKESIKSFFILSIVTVLFTLLLENAINAKKLNRQSVRFFIIYKISSVKASSEKTQVN